MVSGRNSRSLPLVASLAILTVVVISTGSRIPLLALTATLTWLSLSHRNRRSLVAIGIATSAVFTLLVLNPKLITQRGFSYRP